MVKLDSDMYQKEWNRYLINAFSYGIYILFVALELGGRFYNYKPN